MQTSRDVPMHIRSETTWSERRITPSWTIAHLKSKLEPITGVPPSSQKLALRLPGQVDDPIEGANEEATELSRWNLQAGAEIYVADTRPRGARTNLPDPSSVPKYNMPVEIYETLPDSVLAWKKNNKLGRFDPNAPEIEKQKLQKEWQVVDEKGIEVSKRCRLGSEDTRRGTVAYVGEVPEIAHQHGIWVGVILDEPLGKNDGSVGGKRYFKSKENFGVFVRPDRIEVGHFEALEDLEESEDMEEI